MFAHKTTNMSLQIEACLWCVSLSLLEVQNMRLITNYLSKDL